MSLMKLLTVSRSFVTGQSQLGRYRMVGRRGGLPQFRPTGRRVHPAVAPTPARSPSACQSDLPKLVLSNDRAPVQPAEPRKEPATKAVKAAKSPFAVADAHEPKVDRGPGERPGPARRVISRLRGWFRPKPKRRFKSAFAGTALRSPVQVHLALESVQVVRNDLSDSEFEVRTVGIARGAGARSRPALEQLKHGLAGMSWSQVTARLFENGRPRAQTR